jgi:uncharacterized protein YndB with AHSA1/START domain
MSRTYDARVESLWAAWTDAEAFASWYGPYGSIIRDCSLDTRPGGRMRFWHLVPGLPDQWVDGEYEEVLERELIQVALRPQDLEQGVEPWTVRVIVRFASEGSQTRMAVRHAGLRGHDEESRWWAESLDRLGEYLASGESGAR